MNALSNFAHANTEHIKYDYIILNSYRTFESLELDIVLMDSINFECIEQQIYGNGWIVQFNDNNVILIDLFY